MHNDAMANVTKPLLQGRAYFGEDEAHDLILWMNCNEYRVNTWVTAKNRRPAFKRVFTTFELAKQVESDLRAGSAGLDEVSAHIRHLNRAIARYTFRPHFPDPARFSLRWRAPSPEMVIPSEHRAILSLLRTLEIKRVNRVRACGHCTKWFFARFSHSKFCHTKCQQKQYASSPEHKEGRRKYMREYRQKYGY